MKCSRSKLLVLMCSLIFVGVILCSAVRVDAKTTKTVKTKWETVRRKGKIKKTRVYKTSKTTKNRTVKYEGVNKVVTNKTVIKRKYVYYVKGRTYARVKTITTTYKKVTYKKLNYVKQLYIPGEVFEVDDNLLANISKHANENIMYEFKRMGFELIIDPDAEYSGHLVGPKRKVILREANERVFLHEMGHFLADLYNFGKNDIENMKKIYEKEKGNFIWHTKVYACSNVDEFFAESYAMYELDRVNLKKQCPETYAKIEEMLEYMKPIKKKNVA